MTDEDRDVLVDWMRRRGVRSLRTAEISIELWPERAGAAIEDGPVAQTIVDERAELEDARARLFASSDRTPFYSDEESG